ncbi:hypothetical protein [Streptomyces niveus]|uniref:hypothetical protein n=1 Tax=Streptomyces niveus TaxID=193462 RepID=UPI00341BEDC3
MPEPIRKGTLPCTPPPEWEFTTVVGGQSDDPGVLLFPGNEGPVVVRRLRIYGDWEPVRPDRWMDEPHAAGEAASGVQPNQPAPDGRRLALLARAIRDATCEGNCGRTEEECEAASLQPVVWHHGVLARVEGTPEQIAAALLPAIDAFARELTAKVRALHRPVQHNGRTICAERSGWDGSTDNSPVAYDQCRTLRALDGPDSS